MKRKIIKQGLGGFTIYLPKKWVTQKGLQGGQEVEVVEKDDALVIQAHSTPAKKEGTVRVDTKDNRFLRYILNNYYRAGYDKITLQGEVNEQEVHAALRLLLGFEITSVGKHEIIIESVAKSSDYDVGQLLKRIFFIVKQDLLTMTENLLAATSPDHETIARNSDTVIRTSNLYIRLIAQHPDPKQGSRSTLANLLTWVHRQLYYLSLQLAQKKREYLKAKEKEFITAVSKLATYLYEGIFTSSQTSFEKIHQHYNRYEKEMYSLAKNKSEYVTAVIYHFLLIQKYIHHATSSGIGLIT